MTTAPSPAAASGTFRLGGDLPLHRLGFGAMRITGPGIWGEPQDPDEVVRVLRRLIELGVTFIDTADSYGPSVSERLIKQALHPYPAELVIATKGGFTRPGPGMWHPNGRPEYLRRQAELSLRNLGVDRIDLYQLHRIDPMVPVEESLGELTRLQQEGKIRHIGMSQISVAELKQARAAAGIVSVQNRYNLADRASEDVLDYCEAESLAFIPWFPIATGSLADAGGPLARISKSRRATPSQLALAWLLRRSPVILPIPGTSSVAHLEENVAAAAVRLSDEEFKTLATAV
ncbi:aldo/keto reductase [Streptomyces sp. NBC_00038]|uniref:aldo/keto reductase n=1 Tax=Streptomyces sp. NBC_00038 TaxID=2903615 RepID=UPI00224FDAB4|nr:aldo/keto reductase [Streptomyces sp. NBC_00038]MCX5554539.1 aldo/keto reductase [Streptomyces sp. NBC_00038]